MHPVVIGAGPAGLSAALQLGRHGIPCVLLEADPGAVGGISRTVVHRGHRFDLGGHRFYTRNPEVERLWREWLDDWRVVWRASRILFRGRMLDYPLRPWNALVNLGPVEAARCVASYLWARLRPRRTVRSFEDWVSHAFGERLYRNFFEAYTEKVWGVSCRDISADWAAQRIGRLDLGRALAHALLPARLGRPGVRSLAESFLYPTHGPGMLWDAVADRARAGGADLRMGSKVVRVAWERRGILEVEFERAGSRESVTGTHVISSMPLPHLVQALDPAPPGPVIEAARALRHRAFIVVALVLDRSPVTDVQWLYVHERHVRVGRIQDYRNWSPAMAGHEGWSVVGFEYFCDEGDGLWNLPDPELVDLACREGACLGLIDPARVRDAGVARVPMAYPVYDDRYRERVARVREFLEKEIPCLQVVGRNGMHRYNNQDHAMLTGLLAADNVAGLGPCDPWSVNSEEEHLEHASGPRVASSGDG